MHQQGPVLLRHAAAAVLSATIFAAMTSSAAAQSPLQAKAVNLSRITPALQAKGRVRVIVEFAVPKRDLHKKLELLSRRAEVRSGQDAILRSAFGSVPAVEKRVSRMSIKPMFAMSLTAKELNRLAADRRVTRIYRDGISRPTLIQAIPLIGADVLQSAGGTGEGQIVAIVDSGVERTHDFIRSRVIMGACFTTTDAGDGAASTCRRGRSEDIGKKAGNPCKTSSSCLHGTHVAGIAAGNLTHAADHPGEPLVGTAPKASIVAISVFSAFGTSLGAYDSDIEKALEFVFDNQSTFEGKTFTSINMSLGDGTNNATNCDATDPLTSIINDLRAANIATAIAAGNESRTNGVAAPGCISSAITVGSTTKTDVVSSFSNIGDLVDVVAPGSSIRSSVLHNAFGTLSGTSMATPFVTGTWAALRSLHPTATVDEIEAALESTGPKIKDTRTGGSFKKPRIQVDAANTALTP